MAGVGGDEENRTPDPLLARQVLSQLSYAPIVLYLPQVSDLSICPALDKVAPCAFSLPSVSVSFVR